MPTTMAHEAAPPPLSRKTEAHTTDTGLTDPKPAASVTQRLRQHWPALSAWDRSALVLTFALLAIAIPAGGLGVAPVAALAGLIILCGMLSNAALQRRPLQWRSPPVFVWTFLVFFLWAVLSIAWSPYDSLERVTKFALGLPLYAALVWACARNTENTALRIQPMLVFAILASSTVFAFEILTQGELTRAGGRLDRPQAEIWRNLGHGLSVSVALLPAFLTILWTQGKLARSAGLTAVAIVLAGGFVFGLSVNVLGFCAGAAAMSVAVLWPRAGVVLAGAFAAGSIVFAPVFALFSALPETWLRELPLSWRQRVEIWRAAVDFIKEKPLLGHGFDAARTRHSYAILEGREFDVMPLHPHNAGLHIWFETGLIGVTLFGLSVVLMTHRIAKTPMLQRTRAIAVAGSLASFAAMATVAYGVWQEWWVATAFVMAGACLLTGRRERLRGMG